jgi:hypothetical protein
MSQYARTYKDNLRALKKEQAAALLSEINRTESKHISKVNLAEITKTEDAIEIPEPELLELVVDDKVTDDKVLILEILFSTMISDVPTQVLFESFVYDLSNLDLEPIKLTYFYKKSHAKSKHNFTFDVAENTVHKPRNNRKLFKQSITILEQSLTTSDYNRPVIDEDFLTMFYLIKSNFIKLPKNITSYHTGITSDGLLRGLFSTLKKGTRWNFYGCDRVHSKLYTDRYVNGIKKPCDALSINTIRSINIQLSEKIAPNSIDLFTCDIKPSTAVDVFKQYLICANWLTANGVILLRLPLNWNNNYTAMVTLIIYFQSHYNTVLLFKTPWNAVPKLYLIVSQPKEGTIDSPKLLAITSYVTDIEKLPTGINTSLFSSIIWNDEEDSDQMQQLVSNVTNTYKQCLSTDNLPENEEDAALLMLSLIG